MGSKEIKLPDGLTKDTIEEYRYELLDFRELMTYFSCAMMEIETKFKVLDKQFSLLHDYNPIETIKTRLKSPESIIGKLKRRELPFSLEAIEKELHDVAGVRVICPFIDDIYLLAEWLSKQDDVRLLEKKDYIANPKENGYRSLHLIVEIPIFLQNEKKVMKVEVQLRTIAMDFWASLEHRLRYKKEVPKESMDMLKVELKECADLSASLDWRMETVKNKLGKKPDSE